MHDAGVTEGRKLLEFVMSTKGASRFIAGELSLADLFLAPIAFYVSLTPDAAALFSVAGFADWWANIQALPSYRSTIPNLS
jgi:glutathione S-transferase